MRRHGPFCFYAFDLLWLDGRDLRDRPLIERKSLLRRLFPRRLKSVLYVDHVASGTDLFRAICGRDARSGFVVYHDLKGCRGDFKLEIKRLHASPQGNPFRLREH
jgi:hypothetical protein